MKYQTSDDIKIGNIHYFTELSGDAPITVYVIHGSKGDMLIDTGFKSTFNPLLKWIKRNEFNITDIFITHATSLELMNESYRKILQMKPMYLACGHGCPFIIS